VTCFDDLAVYSAIYRPGPLNMGMDARYCKRKKNEEPFNIHPVMKPSLGKTYGVLVFQEQVMDILRVVGLIPDMHTEKVRKAISKKKVKDFEKYQEQFIDNGQKILAVNADYVVDLWNQIAAFAEYGFNASHAYAYAYISARLLWLKAHYPLEFYTAILMCEDDEEKFKAYKLDAKNHDIEVRPVHINKSKANFAIADDKIFFGFSNIKSIGEGAAERIVEFQPYKGFPDFLERYGTDATPIKALTSLGVFEESKDRLTMRKFAEYFKKEMGSRKDRKKRFEASMDKKLQDLREKLLEEAKETDEDFEEMCAFTDVAECRWKERFEGILRDVPYKYKGEERIRQVSYLSQLQAIAKKRLLSIESFAEKEKEDESDEWLSLDTFNPSQVKIDPEEELILTDELEIDGVKSYPLAERKYYGFQWTHRLETCPDYTGATIDAFLESVEEGGVVCAAIEVEIVAVKERLSKKNVPFWSLELEDANGKRMFCNVWSDDHTRFKEELVVGNLIKIRVKPPSGGFNTLTFDSVPKHLRKKLPPKEEDYRLIVMKRPPEKPKKSKAEMDLDNMVFDPNAVVIPKERTPEEIQLEQDAAEANYLE
jgi:DNA polymerase III alpha subunit